MNLDSIAQELDRLYIFEISRYIERCDELKKSGFKVYRNSSGQHKVVMAGQGAQNTNRSRRQPEQREAVNDKKENIFVRAKKRIKRSVENFKAIVSFIKFLRDNQNNGKMY